MKNDSSISSSSSSSLLRWVTLGVLLCVVGIAVVMESTTPWSAEIKERVREERDKLGSPVLFAELARGREDFARVFGPAVVAVPQSAAGSAPAGESEDLKSLRRSLFLDSFFIVAYTALLFVLGLRSWNSSPRQRAALRVWLPMLLLLPPVIGVCDAMENAGIANSLKHLRDATLTNEMVTTTRAWSMTKWQLYFVNLLLLGWSFIGTEPWRCRDCPVRLRRLAALLLVAGAVVGFGGLVVTRLVPAGFLIAMGAMTPVLLMLALCPDGVWRRE